MRIRVEGRVKVVEIGEKRIAFGPVDELPDSIYLGHQSSSKIWFPLRDMSVEPFENFKAALRLGVKLLEERGEVAYSCDGGCGRSGSLAVALAAYLVGDEAKRIWEATGCPETILQLEVALEAGKALREGKLDSYEPPLGPWCPI